MPFPSRRPVLSLFLGAARAASATEPDELTGETLPSSDAHAKNSSDVKQNQFKFNRGQGKKGVDNIDSIPNWSSSFSAQGVDANNNPQSLWYYNMVGGWPHKKNTTVIRGPIVPVSLDLRNADGSPRYVNGHRLFSDATQFVQPVFQSPVFQNYTYSSSNSPTQYTDAVQRAEFFNFAKSEWHTLLAGNTNTTPQTMVLKRGTYRFALNKDGTCCHYVLVDETAFGNALFPATAADTTTPIGAAEHNGDVTTKDISTFLFPNTFLTDSSGGCCIIGYHTYDSEPGDPTNNNNQERRYVLDYASWITPGIFGGGFQDVTALSHELSEIFNDPFVTSDGVLNIVPWWQSPNGNCQNNLEDGDVIEGLPNSTYPITMPNGYTYHPQNEPMFSYFARETPSTAIHGAYSYPNESTLTSISPPERANCQ